MNRLKDRTNEFKSAVESSRTRNESSSSSLIVGSSSSNVSGNVRSEFAKIAGKIGKDIQGTTIKLEKLAQRELLTIIY
jgi:syntaxin 5